MIPKHKIVDGLKFTWRCDLPRPKRSGGGWQKITAKCTVLDVGKKTALLRVEHDDERGVVTGKWDLDVISEWGEID
jgi:hypothetical protein